METQFLPLVTPLARADINRKYSLHVQQHMWRNLIRHVLRECNEIKANLALTSNELDLLRMKFAKNFSE